MLFRSDVLVDGAILVSGSNESEIAKKLEDAKALIGKMGYDDATLRVAMTKLEGGH